MGLKERKIGEIGRKIAGLGEEFDHWRALSGAGKQLEKHHSQILRITNNLGGFQGQLRADVDKGDILRRLPELEKALRDLYRLWGYFRDKLAQRFSDEFLPYLVAADEFAWWCYQPLRDAAIQAKVRTADSVKEPPLVYLSAGESPFTLPRDAAWGTEIVADPLETSRYIKALKGMPMSVIGVPWSQLRHLPDALVIGHEVGHNIESDLELTETLHNLVDRSVGKARRANWRAWIGEVFADTYGALCGGPAFAGSLIDFLAAEKREIEFEVAGADDLYPPVALRVRFVFAVLAERGFVAEADALANEWLAMFPKHAMAAYEPDLAPLARALLDGPYPSLGAGASLQKLHGFTRADHTQAVKDAGALLNGYAPQSTQIHQLLAASRLAFAQDPTNYDAAVEMRVKAKIQKNRAAGVRSSPDGVGTKEARNSSDADVRRGEALADAWLAEGPAKPPHPSGPVPPARLRRRNSEEDDAGDNDLGQ